MSFITNSSLFRSRTLDCGPTFIPASIRMLKNRSMRRGGRKKENGTASEKGRDIGTEIVKETGREKTKGNVLKTLPLKRMARKVQSQEPHQPQRSIEGSAKITGHTCSFPHLCHSTSHICPTCTDIPMARAMSPAIQDTGGCPLSWCRITPVSLLLCGWDVLFAFYVILLISPHHSYLWFRVILVTRIFLLPIR